MKRRLLTFLTCSTMLLVGPCSFQSWSVAIDPGMGDKGSFVGLELDFGKFDFVVPLISLER